MGKLDTKNGKMVGHILLPMERFRLGNTKKGEVLDRPSCLTQKLSQKRMIRVPGLAGGPHPFEDAFVQERDPIALFKDSLKEAKVFGDKDFEKIEKEAAEAVVRAVEFADESPLPDESELLKHIYA